MSSSRSINLSLLASVLRSAAAPTPHPKRIPTPYRGFSSTRYQAQDPAAPAKSSVSEAEISHFSRLASSWWDPHGSSRLLHLMNPLRHDFIQACLQSSPSHAELGKQYTYLDVGCGGGIFSSSAARLPSTRAVTAIDPTPSVIAVAKAHQRSDPALSEPRLRYINCGIEDLPMSSSAENDSQPEQADILTLFEVLEHVSSPSQFLTKAAAHLKSGGWLVGSTISRSTLSFVTTKVVAEAPLIGVVPRGTHDWKKYIMPQELAEWFLKEAAGSWGPMKTQGVIYLPGMGWRMVDQSERLGNYFFGVQKHG